MDKKSIEQSASALKKAKALVRKFTGLSAEDVDDLNKRMKAIGTPSTMEELNRLAAGAGMLGITDKEEILEFVEAADKLGIGLAQFKYKWEA